MQVGKLENRRNMKKLLYAVILPLAAVLLCSCEDEREIDVTPKVYMPQSTWGQTYVINGAASKDNKNYEIDKANNKVNIFLGVYQSGVGELGGFSVDISAGGVPVDGTTLLPGNVYDMPSKISVAEGKRENYFWLEVDLHFLLKNRSTDYSLPVTISNLTKWQFNDKYTTTKVHIKTSELLSKEGL